MKYRKSEIEKNREAAMALVREAAMHGNPIAGALFELESWASQTSWGRYTVTTMQDFR